MKTLFRILFALPLFALAQPPPPTVGSLSVQTSGGGTPGLIMAPVSAAVFKSANGIASTAGTVASITGTSGQILANGLTTAQTGAVTLTLPSALVLPGTINGLTLTTGTGTLTLGTGKTTTFNSTSTFSGTDAQTYTFPTTSATLARTDAANTFTGTQTFSNALNYGGVTLSNAVTGTGNMVLSASPTLTGTLTAAAITASGILNVGGYSFTSGTLSSFASTAGIYSYYSSGGVLSSYSDGAGTRAVTSRTLR